MTAEVTTAEVLAHQEATRDGMAPRRTWTVTGSAPRRPRHAAAIMLAGLLLLAGCRSAATAGPSGGSSAPVTAPTTAAPTSTGLRIGTDAMIAADLAGNILELAPDGSTRRSIAPDVATGGPPGHVAVTANGSTVYYDRGPTGCWSEFTYEAGEGGGPGVAGTGAWPTPDATNTHLAVITGTDPCKPDTMLVYDVPGGGTHSWQLDPQLAAQGFHLAGPLGWSPDGKLLAVPVASASAHRLLLVDLSATTTVTGPAVAPVQSGGSVLAAFFTATGLITLESCCGGTPTYRLSQRALTGTTAGAAGTSLVLARPLDVHATYAGRVTVVGADKSVQSGQFPNLKSWSGKYVAADTTGP